MVDKINEQENVINNIKKQLIEKENIKDDRILEQHFIEEAEYLEEERALDKRIDCFFSKLNIEAKRNVDIFKANCVLNVEDRVSAKKGLIDIYTNNNELNEKCKKSDLVTLTCILLGLILVLLVIW